MEKNDWLLFNSSKYGGSRQKIFNIHLFHIVLLLEILTYEDVSLFLSKTGKKRPIVLCGPEGVGCLELRQRLAETDKQKFASAIPRKFSI